MEDERFDGSVDVKVEGAQKLAALAARLKAADRPEISRLMKRRLRDAAGIVQRAEAEAARALPAHKYDVGLRAAIADSIVVRTRSTGARAGVRVKTNSPALGSKARLPRLMNRGHWRHPVFGNRRNWADQTSRAGWWDTTADAHASRVRREMKKVLDDIAAELEVR